MIPLTFGFQNNEWLFSSERVAVNWVSRTEPDQDPAVVTVPPEVTVCENLIPASSTHVWISCPFDISASAVWHLGRGIEGAWEWHWRERQLQGGEDMSPRQLSQRCVCFRTPPSTGRCISTAEVQTSRKAYTSVVTKQAFNPQQMRTEDVCSLFVCLFMI